MYKIKRFSKESEDFDKDDAKVAGGLAGIGLGAKLANSSKSKITGLENFYHNTDSKNIRSILNEGIKAKFAEDPNNLTNQVLGDVSMDKKKGKVYLGRKKSVSDSVGLARDIRSGGSSKTLKVNIPYEDLKKMKEVDNPELRGAKSKSEFAKKLIEKESASGNPLTDSKFGRAVIGLQGREVYNTLGREGTTVIEGDIASKYIKGSKDYQKYGLKEMGNYIKHNPGRFAKGVAKGAAGLGLATGGGYLAYKGVKGKKSKEDK